MRLLQAFLRGYARGQATAVAPFIVGRRLLDLGAGEGYLTSPLGARRDVWVCSCDVGPFRQTASPYLIYDGRDLPFADATFDTTLLLLTLHHCHDPERVLDEALRVTRHRLIVTESVFRNRADRLWLVLLDRRLNARRHGGAMNTPLKFRTSDEWRALFAARGLRLTRTDCLGSWWERLVHHPVLFVLDAASSLAPRTVG